MPKKKVLTQKNKRSGDNIKYKMSSDSDNSRSQNIVVINSSREFKDLVEDSLEGTLFLVDFHAQWCPPCHKLAPELERIAEKYKDADFRIVKIDTDANQDLAIKYNIRSIPSVKFFRSGKLLDDDLNFAGFRDAGYISNLIDSVLAE